MSQVIAGIYEIDQKIGAGGGGVVYLGRHLRLQKLVVLKADRRNLNTRPEALRREVDMLKILAILIYHRSMILFRKMVWSIPLWTILKARVSTKYWREVKK